MVNMVTEGRGARDDDPWKAIDPGQISASHGVSSLSSEAFEPATSSRAAFEPGITAGAEWESSHNELSKSVERLQERCDLQ
jgi:hypothetical protein